MKTILLSFKANVHKKVLSGEKIYEYRKVFPDGPIKAYLYVSAPIKSIVGIMHLDNRINLHQWKQKFSNEIDTVERIDEYLKSYKYAVEINSFQNTNMISLEQLRKDIPGFVVPQMYYYIDNTFLISYLDKHLINRGDLIEHTFNDISSRLICRS